MKNCYAMVELLGSMTGPYGARIKAIRGILSDKRLERLGKVDIYKALPVRTLAFYDHLLKTRLVGEMEDILSFIYELDVNIAVSEVARVRGFVYAHALPPENNIFSADDLCHPCIDGAVGNSLSLRQERNVLFLTGANMAGKTTPMKIMGVAALLAHFVLPLAANRVEIS